MPSSRSAVPREWWQSKASVRCQVLAVAQVMGLDRRLEKGQYTSLDKTSPVQAEHLWFRIVSLDRHLSFLLGPTQGTRGVVMASAAVLRQRTVIACLECLHCVVQRAEVIRKEPR